MKRYAALLLFTLISTSAFANQCNKLNPFLNKEMKVTSVVADPYRDFDVDDSKIVIINGVRHVRVGVLSTSMRLNFESMNNIIMTGHLKKEEQDWFPRRIRLDLDVKERRGKCVLNSKSPDGQGFYIADALPYKHLLLGEIIELQENIILEKLLLEPR